MVDMDYMIENIKDGFSEERLVVIGRELVERKQRLPICSNLHVTAIGHFPRAKNHYIRRTKGISDYILIYCASGKGRIGLPRKTSELQGGQLTLIPAGVPHEYRAHPTAPWSIYWLHFAGSQAEEYAHLLAPNARQPTLQINDSEVFIQQFENLYARVVNAFSDPELIYGSSQLAQTLCLAHRLRTEKNKKGRQNEQRILSSIRYITTNYATSISLPELAHQAHLSVPQYGALFRRQTGTSPIRYLTRVRLRHACKLLNHSAMQVAEIAYTVGYRDEFYFSRHFSRNIGLSPSAYRTLRK